MDQIDTKMLDQALSLVAKRLELDGAAPIRLVVCGGASLIATNLVLRTTRDVDIVALADADGKLLNPAPLPPDLEEVSKQVSSDLGLKENWLNNGPSSGEGGLFQMGLPEGFVDRLQERAYGEKLTVYFIDRLDQIHFKLYASIDRGGYHIDDLKALNPTDDEIEQAARWSMTHDVSEGYAEMLRQFLKEFGYESVAERI